jgi:hypothetical protein
MGQTFYDVKGAASVTGLPANQQYTKYKFVFYKNPAAGGGSNPDPTIGEITQTLPGTVASAETTWQRLTSPLKGDKWSVRVSVWYKPPGLPEVFVGIKDSAECTPIP